MREQERREGDGGWEEEEIGGGGGGRKEMEVEGWEAEQRWQSASAVFERDRVEDTK